MKTEADIYNSCMFIEGGLTLAPDGLYACSIPLNGVSGWAPFCDYTGGPLPVDQILEARARHREEIRTGASMSCKGCFAFQQERAWRDENPYLFNNLNIEHYTVCNLRCSYCCWSTTHPIEFGHVYYPLLPILQEIVENKWMDPNGSVFWGGGEPALLNEFPECLELMLGLDFAHEISSNATHRSEAIMKHLSNPKMMLTVSVDAGRAETYLAIKGQDRLNEVWENLEAYASTGGRMNVKYIMIDENRERAEWMPFVERVEELGLGGSVMLDISHGDPADVTPIILESLVEMEQECLQRGFNVSCGAHGAHSLPALNLTAKLDALRERLAR